MDNNAFENNMINAVNKNAQAASVARASQFQEDAKKWMERRRKQRLKAFIEILCWLVGFVTIVFAMGALTWLDRVPGEYAIAISAVFGFITGCRVCGLVNVI